MKDLKKNMKLFWKYAKDDKKDIIIYFLLSVFGAIVGIIYPIMSAQIIVKLTDSMLEQCLYITLVLYSVLALDTIKYVFSWKLYERIFREIYVKLQFELGNQILKLNNKTLEDNGTGVFIQRLTGDTRQISDVFNRTIQYLTDFVYSVGIIVSYFVISKKVFIFVVISIIIRFLIETKRINVKMKNEKEFKKANDKVTGFTSEIVRGAEDIKMLNGEKSFLKELYKRFKNLNQKAYKMNVTNANYRGLRMGWDDASGLIIIVLLLILVKINDLTIPMALVLFNFGSRYVFLTTAITGIQEEMQQFNLSAGRIFELYEDDKYTTEKFGSDHLDRVNGDFEFKNVSFKYDKNKVLNKLNFKVNANETVAFVGKSGAGKTTIFNLLCKMYDNYTGTITIDDKDIKELDKDTIRGNITIVSQNPYIFNMSIKDNLRLVKEKLTDEEMKEACKMACLDKYIESLPDKYNTIVGEGGINLSGGQKQRLAIARAFVQKTEIILFDEATSALDNETQQMIQQAIDNLQKEYTILIIAHRLSTIKNADRILVLDDGKIIAEGKHEELLDKCKEYKELYETEITKIDEQ